MNIWKMNTAILALLIASDVFFATSGAACASEGSVFASSDESGVAVIIALIFIAIRFAIWASRADEREAAGVLSKCLVAKVEDGAEIVLFTELGKRKKIVIPTIESDFKDNSNNEFKARVVSINPVAFAGLEETVEFRVDPENQYFSVKDGVLFSKDGKKLLAYPKKKPGARYVVPETVEVIGTNAFDRCAFLEELVLPSGLREIEACAIDSCDKIVEIVIPDGVETIADLNFTKCDSLTRITISEKNERYRTVDGVLFSKDGTKLCAYPSGKKESEYVVPEDVLEIGAHAFSGCESLKSIRLPQGIKTIPENAFAFCVALEKIELPDGMTTIGSAAFMGCASLVLTSLPQSVVEIGENAFSLCLGIEKIKLPSGLLKIEDGTFLGCARLTAIDVPESATYIGANAFAACVSLTVLKLRRGLKEIGDSAFEGCSSLETLAAPEGVVRIGAEAFKDCEKLGSVELPSSLAVVGKNAFKGCKAIRDVVMPAALKKSVGRAFSRATVMYIE